MAQSQTPPFFYGNRDADEIIRRGLNLSYNLEYDPANKAWDSLIRMYPDHPAGFAYKAALLWWQATEDRQNQGLQDRFVALTKVAIEKGIAWNQKHPGDKVGLAYLASAYGNASRFDVTVTHSYLSALRNGKKGLKYIEMAHQIDPNFYDTYVGLGSFNYFTGALPGVIKPFAWLLGARGNKDLGIRQLKLAAEKGEFARTEANIILLSVYITEKDWESYQRQLEMLMEQYPLNHVFYTWASNQYIGMKRWDAGIAFFNKLKDSLPAGQGEYSAQARAWIDYNLGRNYFAKQDWGDALNALDEAEKGGPKIPVMPAQLYLLKGNTLDVLGRRGEAVAAYHKALDYPNIDDCRQKARRYLKSPYH